MLSGEWKNKLFFGDNLSRRRYVQTDLTAELVSIAGRRGVSLETLFNLWIQEKVKEESAAE